MQTSRAGGHGHHEVVLREFTGTLRTGGPRGRGPRPARRVMWAPAGRAAAWHIVPNPPSGTPVRCSCPVRHPSWDGPRARRFPPRELLILLARYLPVQTPAPRNPCRSVSRLPLMCCNRLCPAWVGSYRWPGPSRRPRDTAGSAFARRFRLLTVSVIAGPLSLRFARTGVSPRQATDLPAEATHPARHRRDRTVRDIETDP